MNFEDLENASHEQLAALLAGANPEALIQRGETLEGVARAVAQVGTAVAHHTRLLEWEGETATVLREWVTRFEHDSDHFRAYTKAIGMAIRASGQALKEAASSMPPVPPTVVPESVSQEAFGAYLGEGAMSENERLRQEAIGVVNRLGQAYQVAATTVKGLPEPQFVPLDHEGIYDPSEGPSPSGRTDYVGTSTPVPTLGSSGLRPDSAYFLDAVRAAGLNTGFRGDHATRRGCH